MLSMKFPTQEHWSGLPFPTPGGSSPPKNQAHVSYVSCIAGGFFTHWAISFFHLWPLSCTSTGVPVGIYPLCICCLPAVLIWALPSLPYALCLGITYITFREIWHCFHGHLMTFHIVTVLFWSPQTYLEHKNTPLVVKLCLRSISFGLYSLH